MPALKYRVMLMDDERAALEALVTKGKCAARTQTRARILLKAADGWQDAAIMAALNVSATMVAKIRQRCVEDGVEAALKDRPRPGQKRKLTDRQAAHLIAIACSEAPDGHIGPYGCWLTKWWNCNMPTPAATKPSANF